MAALGPHTPPRTTRESGRRGRLSVTWVFFLVVSAASPVTSLLGAVPLGFVNGNGAGLPAAFAVVTVVLICFAVGYAAISRRVINTGAFYTYIAQGIGRPPAIGAALLAVAAYTVNVAGIAGASGYFVHVIAAELGADVSWIWGTVPLLLLVGFVGYRSVHVSAKLIGHHHGARVPGAARSTTWPSSRRRGSTRSRSRRSARRRCSPARRAWPSRSR